ncbi:helix-turn-helix domain-containing protein [Paraflavitalea speifideaquila]|uniref:helix-turn-helix domain-containing protein n=1 Tax=Paraflavitalea speifideaquila TaxID=3076558 RepID=UPI0028E71A25|nr:helix-turn-helix domain-containing protein [Paraflavitalea speifideiaquila]
MSQLLNLSADSVYRRIRGEKPVTLIELKQICEHYRLSLDQLLQLKNDSVLFQAPGITNPSIPFASHMKGMLDQFKYFNSFKQGELYYLCKDAPFWYFYLFPGMAAFKTFFWCKTINNEPALIDQSFSLEEHRFEECFAIGQQILDEHSRMNTIELWNLESIHSSINQIAYYREAGIFREKKDLLAVVESFIQMVDHLQAQAGKGVKFMPGTTDVAHRGPIQFYVNELILGNNTILLNLDNKKISMITYSVFSYLITQDDRFAAKAFDTFNTLLSKSTLVSRSGEKDRNRFFNTLRD